MKQEIYREKIYEYREKYKNKEILKFVDALETILDWLDRLYETKGLSKEQEKEVSDCLPKETFNELDKISLEINQEEYNKLKEILLKEISELINYIINVGYLKLADFGLLQFNLSQIFSKEEITILIEWERHHLMKVISEREEETEEEKRRKIIEREKWLEKVREMPQLEMNKLIIASMFEFKVGARTPEERLKTIEINREKIQAQRIRFRKFERKLIDASQEAAEYSQINVFRKVGEVKREMERVRDKFREKAEKIVSPEGPRKELRKAKTRILEAKKQTSQEILNAEKMFDYARKNMAEKKERLEEEQEEKRGFIQKQGLRQINLGKHIVDQAGKYLDLARQHMEDEKTGAEKLFEAGRRHLALAKKHMEDEKQGTENMFNKGRQDLASAKKHLEEEQQNFEKTKAEAETILGLVAAGLKQRKKKEEERIILIRNSLLPKGRETTKKLREKMMSARTWAEKAKVGTDKVRALVPEKPKLGIKKEDTQEKYKLKKDALTRQLQNKKQLIEYDLRFKRDELQQRALKQKEDMINKFEEFEERQRALIARYRASRKAYMIRTLLKAIRAIH